MTGHLDEFWPDVGSNSGWMGDTGESGERGPYFLDGLLPLAYLLNDEVLKAKAKKLSLKVPAKRLDPWRSEDGVAKAPPVSPAVSDNELETLTFIPYGAAKLRVTAFPSLLS